MIVTAAATVEDIKCTTATMIEQTSQNSATTFEKCDMRHVLDDSGSDDDVEMGGIEETIEKSTDRLIIAVDFGTTFSSVAYSRFNETTPGNTLGLTNVTCIGNYPDDRSLSMATYGLDSRKDVPTELWYDIPTPGRRGRKPVDVIMETVEENTANNDDAASDSSSELSFLAFNNENEPELQQNRSEQRPHRPEPLHWGFGVQKHLNRIETHKDTIRRLARFKLMLDERKETKDIRQDLAPVLKTLRKSKLIEEDTDVISDYLRQLFRHVRSELEKEGQLDGDVHTEFVLCVPAVWPSKACRVMQTAMVDAIQGSGLGSLTYESLDNLFIMSEPEAAAACVLAEDNNDIFENETIVILDAGGGTVDAVTYQITNSLPLRLSAEVVDPGTRLCGSSYINERYEKVLLKRLKHEDYLAINGTTIRSIVDEKVTEFENIEKRFIDTTLKNFDADPVRIANLRPNPKRNLRQNHLEISRREMKAIFEESLRGAAELLIEQLERAKAKKCTVQKVILIGGFGQSPALRSTILKTLETQRNFLGQNIDFLPPITPPTAVARGAILRAFNKEHGPKRVTQCSYGFLRTEPYEPNEYAAHMGAKPRIDRVDGERYIDGTIDWFIQKGQEIPNNKEYSRIVQHTFPAHWKKLVCKEELYVSDNQHQSHYRRLHAENKGAELAGSITANMTWLKEQDLIKLQQAETRTSKAPKSYWSITWELVLTVDGRNLRYEARWPAPDNKEHIGKGQQVHARGQTSIAAAFRPGTA